MRIREGVTPPDAIGHALERVHAEGHRAHGALGVDATAFRAAVEPRLAARLAGLGLEPSSAEALDLVAKADAAGLYLAVACDTGHGSAWEVLTRTYTPRLVGLAVRRGLDPSEAATLVDDALGALALPPPRGDSSTRMGTYLGAGSLFGWLATIVVRRMADRARGRRTASLDAEPRVAEGVAAEATDDPAAAVLSREATEAVVDGLTEAWSTLTPRERLALALKYRDGLTQRVAARLLGVGEPRVSRLVHRALDKIRGPLSAVAGGVEDGRWPALRDAIQARLAILAAEVRPPAGGDPPRGARDGT